MASVNPSLVSAYNSGAQQFYTTQQVDTIPAVSGNEAMFPAVEGAFYYESAGSAVPLTFDQEETAVGTDVVIDGATGEITLQQDITYNITVTSERSLAGGVAAGFYQVYDLTNAETVGIPVPFGLPLVITVTPAAETVYEIIATNAAGTAWTAPGQIVNAAITVTAVSGFEQ